MLIDAIDADIYSEYTHYKTLTSSQGYTEFHHDQLLG